MAIGNNYQDQQIPNNGQMPQQFYYNQPNYYRPVYQNPPMNNSIIWVQGEQAARSYPLAPSTTMILWDSDNDVFYRKTTNAQGKPINFDIFDYTKREVIQENQNSSIEELFKEVRSLSKKIDALEAQKNNNSKNKPQQQRKDEGDNNGKSTI